MKVTKKIEIIFDEQKDIQLLSDIAELARRYIAVKAREVNPFDRKRTDEYDTWEIDGFIRQIFDATQ